MHYRSIIVLFLLIIPSVSHAQVKRALKMIDDGAFQEAAPLLRAALSDERERVLGYYGLARLYADPNYTTYRLDSAYRYIEGANEAYRALDYKDRGRVSKELSTAEIRRVRSDILKAAWDMAEAENTLTAYQHFIDHFPGSGSRYEGKAVELRNRLAFDRARQTDSAEAYSSLLENYGADLKARTPQLYEEAERRQFERYIDENGWDGFENFARQYPDHVYVRDSLYDTFRELWAGPTAGFSAFVDAYPSAPITRYAVDSLGRRLIQQADTVLSRRFLQDYPTHPARDEVYATWYESLKQRFRSMSDLERFRAAHPDFPYPERLTADAELFLDRSYEKLQVGKALGAFRAFIDQHPGYSRIDSVWWRYYLSYKLERPGAEHLERFIKVHPDFPFPEAIEQDRQAFQREAQREEWASVQKSEGTAELFRFIKSADTNPFRDPAIDLLADRLLAEGQTATIEGFLNDYPGHPRRPALLERLWEVFPSKDYATAITNFIDQYPDFPRPQLLQRALEEVPFTDEEVQEYTAAKRPGFIRYIRHYAPETKAFDALWRMLEPLLAAGKWDSAYETLGEYRAYFGGRLAEYDRWLTIFDPANRMQAQSISPQINTDRQEYSAVITADDRAVYFCRNTGTDRIDEDIFVSFRDEAGNWQEAQAVDALVSENNEAPEAVSVDGNRMVLFVEGKICTSLKTREGWSTPRPMSKNINRSSWQSDPCETADGKAIFFASEEGILRGNKDIYVSLRQEDGSWGPAMSIGEQINTDRDDRSPFLHPDMKTLYFSSAGHRGLGGLDIFVSRRLDDSWTNWSEPVNLGPGVNTPANDWSFKVTTDGRQGYYNVLSSKGGGDIFVLPLAEDYRPDPVATVSGRLSRMDGSPIEARIEWVNLSSGAVIQETTSDPETGTFFATLPSLGRFGYTIKKEGYFPISGNLDFSEKLYHHQLDKAMTVVSLEEMRTENLAVPLNNLFFETAKYDIQPESFPELNGLAVWVQDNKLSIEVHGHTDAVGAAEDNRLLSENRAQAVRQYLIGRGLDPDRIRARGFGEDRPVDTNDTPEGRAQNRRVEIRIAQ